jgi:hypothetical protein
MNWMGSCVARTAGDGGRKGERANEERPTTMDHAWPKVAWYRRCGNTLETNPEAKSVASASESR